MKNFRFLVLSSILFCGAARPSCGEETASQTVLGKESRPVIAIAVSPAGTTLAVAGGVPALYAHSETGAVIRSTLPTAGQNAVALNPQGRFAATGGDDRGVYIWDAKTGGLVKKLSGHAAKITALAFMPGAELLASGAQDGTVIVWRNIYYTDEYSRDGKPESGSNVILARMTGSSPVNALAFSPDTSARLAASYRDGTVAVWDKIQGNPHIIKPGGPVDALAFSPDGSILAAGSGGTVSFWNTASWSRTDKATQSGGRIAALAFNPANSKLFTAAATGAVSILSTEGKLLGTLNMEGDSLLSFSLSADGNRAAAGGKGGSITLWTLNTSALTQPAMPVLQTKALPADIRKNDKSGAAGTIALIVIPLLAVTGFIVRKKLFLKVEPPSTADFAAPSKHEWQFPEPESREWGAKSASVIVPHRAPVIAAQCSPTDDYLVSAGPDGKAAVFSGPDGNIVRTIDTIEDAPPRIEFSGDGKMVALAASGAEYSFAHILPIPYGIALHKWKGPRANSICMAFMPGDKQMVLALDTAVMLWDLKPLHKPENLFRMEEASISIRAFPSGRALACLHKSGTISVWVKRREWVKTASLCETGAHAADIAVSPDGLRLAAALADGNVCVWSAPDWKEEKKTQASKTPLSCIAYSHCGRVIGAGSVDGTIVLVNSADLASIKSIPAASGQIAGVSFTSDGNNLASAGGGNAVKFWDVAPCCSIKSRRAKREEVTVDALPPSPVMPPKHHS